MLEEKQEMNSQEAVGADISGSNGFVSGNQSENRAVSDSDNHKVLHAIEASNAEESEEGSKGGQDIPMRDYKSFSMENLVEELQKLITNGRINDIRDDVEEIKKVFTLKYNDFIEEKREEFLSENPDTPEEFDYNFPLKKKLDQLYSIFRDAKEIHFQDVQSVLRANLEKRLAIVDELKELINSQDKLIDVLKHFNDLRERWRTAGPVPKDKYNHVWNNYHFHLENFFDYLHLDREARDVEFKNNLEKKNKLIEKAEALLNEEDGYKAFRELHTLHRIWKEEIGPVASEYREVIWKKFTDISHRIHDKREILFQKQKEIDKENLVRKREIIAEIQEIANAKIENYNQWNDYTHKVETLKNEFRHGGRVPTEFADEIWDEFRRATRSFNHLRNTFHKELKKEQNENYQKKLALVSRAQELEESLDFDVATPKMLRLQDKWKQIGQVPKQYTEKIWKEFREINDHYFDRLKEHKNSENNVENIAYEHKKNFLETIKDFQLSADNKENLQFIKSTIETWKGFGRVPMNKGHIEAKFSKIIDGFFEKLSLSRNETEMLRFSNKVEYLKDSNDTRGIDYEKKFLIRKIDEVKNEIIQLENNIQFFTHSKNVAKENSIVSDVHKKIAAHKENLLLLKEKLKQLKGL